MVLSKGLPGFTSLSLDELGSSWQSTAHTEGKAAVSSNSQGSRCQAVFVFLGTLFILQILSTKVISWIALVSSMGHQSSGKLLPFSSLEASISAAYSGAT